MRHKFRAQPILFAALALSVRSATFAASDRDVRDRIEGVLQGSAKVGHLSLFADVQGGTVRLFGHVPTLEQSWQAEEAVAAVRGVLGIVNQIEIETHGRADASIEREVRWRLEDIPALAAAGIEVKVFDGKVTLRGQVKDARLKLRARDAAAGVEGVVAVLDEIKSPAASDDEILKSAKSLLGVGSFVRVAGVIRPSVKDGVVILEGSVPRLSERRQAERIVWGINGVRDVVNKLEVTPRGVKLR